MRQKPGILGSIEHAPAVLQQHVRHEGRAEAEHAAFHRYGLPLDPVAQDGADRLLGELERVRVLRAGILSLPGCGISLVAGLDMDLLVAPLESDDHHAALGTGHCPETLAAEGTENSLNLSMASRSIMLCPFCAPERAYG